MSLSIKVRSNVAYRKSQPTNVVWWKFDPINRHPVKSQVSNTFAVSTVETNTVQVGVRFLPNTVAGFVQPYVGLEYFTSNQGNQRQGGAIVPVGVIFWISNFMSVSLQPFSFVLAGDTGDAEEYNARFNVDLEMLNPTFGISFLFNARKP